MPQGSHINELVQEQELKLAFERQKHEHELEFKNMFLKWGITQKQQVKLPKLTITKFNDTCEMWLYSTYFRGKFTTEVDKANLATEIKFAAYLKSFLKPKVWILKGYLLVKMDMKGPSRCCRKNKLWENHGNRKCLNQQHHESP